MMRSKYTIDKMLCSLIGYKGLPYPGILLANKSKQAEVEDFDIKDKPKQIVGATDKIIYGKDGIFMPIKLGGLTIPYAVMSVKGKKTIVETALVGAKGTVKELISVDDYDISIAGIFQGLDAYFPEEDIEKFMRMYHKNESVKIESAMAEMIFGKNNDKVVIKSVSFPPMKGVEDMQAIKIDCVTDIPFELIIE